jgi:AcrR family transcriptional regulator
MPDEEVEESKMTGRNMVENAIEEKIRKVCELVAEGMSIRKACKEAHISAGTLYRHLKDEKYADMFSEAFKKGEEKVDEKIREYLEGERRAYAELKKAPTSSLGTPVAGPEPQAKSKAEVDPDKLVELFIACFSVGVMFGVFMDEYLPEQAKKNLRDYLKQSLLSQLR